MKLLFALFLGLHGLLHLLGAAKGLGLADVAQLTQPITQPEGVLWLLAAVLILATAVSLFVLPRWWILIGISALILSQLAISFSWADAGYGTIPNIILLAGLVLGFLSSGPRSFRAEYNREVAQDLARSVPTPLLTEADLVHLPAMVQRYIRRSGAVGLPKVQISRPATTDKSAAGRTRPGCPSQAGSTTPTTVPHACSSWTPQNPESPSRPSTVLSARPRR